MPFVQILSHLEEIKNACCHKNVCYHILKNAYDLEFIRVNKLVDKLSSKPQWPHAESGDPHTILNQVRIIKYKKYSTFTCNKWQLIVINCRLLQAEVQ